MYLGFFVVGRKNTASLAASTTNYHSIGNGFMALNATEASAQVPWRTACILSNLYVRVNSNDRGASTFTTRIGGSPGSQTITIGSSTLGEFEDTTHTDTISAGNLVNASMTTGSGGTTFVHQIVGIKISGQTQLVKYSCNTSKSIAQASTDFFGASIGMSRTGISSINPPEADCNYVMKTNGTLRYFSMNISANARTTSTTYKSRVNSGNGSCSVSIGSGALGQFEDTSNSDSLVVGDSVCWDLLLGSTSEILTFVSYGCEWLPTNQSAHMTSNDNGTTIAPSATNFYGLGCTTGGVATTPESSMQANMHVVYRITNLAFYTRANGLSVTSTVSSRINSAGGTLTLTVSGGAVGEFSDNSNMDFSVNGTEFNWNINTGVGGTTMELNKIGALFTIPNELSMIGAG